VDLPGHPAIVRVAARELQPDSDLGERVVTQAVGDLAARDIDQALTAGALTADRLLRIGLIRSAALSLKGETRIVGSSREHAMIATPTAERIPAHV